MQLNFLRKLLRQTNSKLYFLLGFICIGHAAFNQSGFYYHKASGNSIYFMNSDTVMFLSDLGSRAAIARYENEGSFISVHFIDYHYSIRKCSAMDSTGIYLKSITAGSYSINNRSIDLKWGDEIFLELNWGIDSILKCADPEFSIRLPDSAGCYQIVVEKDASLYFKFPREEMEMLVIKSPRIIIVRGKRFKKVK